MSPRVRGESPVSPSGSGADTRVSAESPVSPSEGSPENWDSSTPIPWLRYGIVTGSTTAWGVAVSA